jgi:hypothetical protein
MGPRFDFAFHVSSTPQRYDLSLRDRLATTSLIVARRIVASVNGNPEFDAAKVCLVIM